ADGDHDAAGADQLRLHDAAARGRRRVDEQRVSEAEDVAGLERALADEKLSIEARSDLAAEVAEENASRLDADFGVAGRHARVVEGIVENHCVAAEEKPVPRNAAALSSAVSVPGKGQYERRLDRGTVCRPASVRAGCVAHCSAPRVRSGRLRFRSTAAGVYLPIRPPSRDCNQTFANRSRTSPTCPPTACGAAFDERRTFGERSKALRSVRMPARSDVHVL